MCLLLCLLCGGGAILPSLWYRWVASKEWDQLPQERKSITSRQSYIEYNSEMSTDMQVFSVISLSALFCAFIGLMISLGLYTRVYALDTKIYNYEVENAILTGELQLMVEDYMGYESQILFSFSDEVSMNAIPPELKADALVVEYMRIYNENRLAILELKNEKASAQVAGWWACFFPTGG